MSAIDTKEEKIFISDPLKIKVREGLERYRRDLGDLKELGKSLQELGQIQPIVINRQNELIAGGRRLAACILRGIKVKTIYKDMVDPVMMRTWELEENLRRKELTPAEYSLAVDELHTLMQKKNGTSTSGKIGGHTLNDTAKILGKTKGSVIGELEIAQMIKAFPALKGAKKKSEIKKAVKGLQKINTAMEGLKELEKVKQKSSLFNLKHADAVKHMQALPDMSKDILLTDPLYGINAEELAIGLGGKTGTTLTSSGYVITDGAKNAIHHLKILAKESFRFTTAKAHGYVFVAPEHFQAIKELFISEGWRVYVKPLIWIKRSVGQCNVPSAWPASCYEMILYIRKDESRIVKEGQPDWIECLPVLSGDKIHPFEKPVPLLVNLLERVAIPGQQLFDPFMGSAPSIEAGLRTKLICEGVDNSLEAYSMAVKRITEYVEKEKRK